MNTVSGARKTESGAELLARLNSRPNLQCVDSFIFGDSSPLSSSSSSSSGGQLVEIFGLEGVGKTELVLHCVAKACLPVMGKGVELNGLGAKVIFIDTDYKFSILRLAIILEKQIEDALSLKNHHCSKTSVNNNKCTADVRPDPSSKYDCNDEKNENFASCNKTSEQKKLDNPENNNNTSAGQSFIKESHDEELKTSKANKKSKTDEDEKVIPKDSHVELCNSDIEEIINESLKNILVLKVSNSEQLLASLLSLENHITEDYLYTLLVIDSVSTFYWIDKAGDMGNANFIERKMAPISDALAHLVNSFGMTCLATTSAFFSGKKLPARDDGGTKSAEGDKDFWMNSEYLGKSWVSTRRKKIILTRKESDFNNEECTDHQDKDSVINAFCNLTKTKKCYVFKDDFLRTM